MAGSRPWASLTGLLNASSLSGSHSSLELLSARSLDCRTTRNLKESETINFPDRLDRWLNQIASTIEENRRGIFHRFEGKGNLAVHSRWIHEYPFHLREIGEIWKYWRDIPRLYDENGKLNIDTWGHRGGRGGHYRKGPGNQWFRLADSPRGIKSFLRGRGGRGSRYYRSFIENKRKGEEEGEEVDDNEALNNRSATERSSGPSQFKPILTISPDPILVLPSWRPIPWPIAAPHRSTATAFTQSS